jgi:hypothetical protein
MLPKGPCCGLLRNKRADKEAKKTAALGPDDGVQRGRISFELVKGLIRSEVKDGPPSHVRISREYGDGPFRCLQSTSRKEEVMLAPLRAGHSLLIGGNPEKGPRDGLYVLTLWGGGDGFRARLVDMPMERELCAGPAATLGFNNRPTCGAVFLGGLQLGSPMIVYCPNNNNNRAKAKAKARPVCAGTQGVH